MTIYQFLLCPFLMRCPLGSCNILRRCEFRFTKPSSQSSSSKLSVSMVISFCWRLQKMCALNCCVDASCMHILHGCDVRFTKPNSQSSSEVKYQRPWADSFIRRFQKVLVRCEEASCSCSGSWDTCNKIDGFWVTTPSRLFISVKVNLSVYELYRSSVGSNKMCRCIVCIRTARCIARQVGMCRLHIWKA